MAGLIAAGAFLVLAVGIILIGFNEGRASRDSRFFHEPAIRTFARELPHPDLTNYLSATTPGYHLLLAVPVRMGLDSTTAIRLMSAAITTAMLFVFAVVLARRWPEAGGGLKPGVMAVLLTLPLIASNYSLFPGVYVLPDNLAWLMVLVLLVRAQRGGFSLASCAASGVVLALLVFTRQIHLWVAGSLVAAAWLGADPDVTRPLWSDLKKRFGPAVLMGLWCVPAVLVVAYFYRLWGGLTPPRFQVTTQSFSPSLPAFLLLEIAVLSVFFVPWLWPVWAGLGRGTKLRIVLVGGAAGLTLALIPVTTWSFWEGRASGWWNIARAGPTLFGRTSVVILLGAPAGAVCLGVWGAGVSRRSRVILGVTLLAFAAAQTASANVWQRYHEPLLLMLMALSVAEMQAALPSRGGLGSRVRTIAPIALAGFLALFTVKALLEGEEDPSKLPDVFGVIPGERAATTPENPEGSAPTSDPEPASDGAAVVPSGGPG